IAVSRPEPGPRTSTSTFFTPCSMAARAHFSAAKRRAEGREFARTLKANLARRGPRQHVAFGVGNGNDGVVERTLDVRDSEGNVLTFLLTDLTNRRWLSHYFVTFFLPATVRLGPLRVRALVRVRWPRTGRPLRWRIPCRQLISILRLMSWATSRRRSPSTVTFWSMKVRSAVTSASERSLTRVDSFTPVAAHALWAI